MGRVVQGSPHKPGVPAASPAPRPGVLCIEEESPLLLFSFLFIFFSVFSPWGMVLLSLLISAASMMQEPEGSKISPDVIAAGKGKSSSV